MVAKHNQKKHSVASIILVLLLSSFSTNTYAAVQDGLIAYWPLDENSGTAAVDVINDHNGTLMGGITWVSGKLGHAVDTHNSGYIVVPEDSQLRPGAAVSLQAWVIVDSFSLWDGIVTAGCYSSRWDGTDFRGEAVASGTYIVTAQVGTHHRSTPLILLR